jgi:hypothetical protein
LFSKLVRLPAKVADEHNSAEEAATEKLKQAVTRVSVTVRLTVATGVAVTAGLEAATRVATTVRAAVTS